MWNSLRFARIAVVFVVLLAGIDTAKGGDVFDLNHYILGCSDYCPGITGPVIVAGAIDASFTGTWYDPAQSGQGLSLEILPDNRVMLAWFTFSSDGTQQTWLTGSGTYRNNVATIPSMSMPTGGRWIPNFDPLQVKNNDWGSLTLTFTDSDHGRVDFNSVLGYGSGSMNLTRLTRPAGINTGAASPPGKTWLRTGDLLTPRAGHMAARLADGRVLVAGGIALSDDTGTNLSSAEVFDPATGTWTSTGSMIQPHSQGVAITLKDGRVLVVDANCELYDPATGRWTSTGSPRTWPGGGGFTVTLLNDGKVLMAGGVGVSIMAGSEYIPASALAIAELYDPESGTWSETESLINPRGFHTASLLPDGRVLVVGGNVGYFDIDFDTVTDTAELYDPVARVWTLAPPISGARSSHTASVLENGDVLIAGGYTGWGDSLPSSLQDAQIYDPSAGTWTTVGSMSVPRQNHTTTRLSDGTVLVAGGVDEVTTYISPADVPQVHQSWTNLVTAELFDPKTGAWSDAGSFDVGPVGYTATPLQNGSVLFAGGGGAENASVSAEVYGSVSASAGAGLTGAWSDPAQPGHGLMLEGLPGDKLLAEWFAFDPAGTQQAWFLGVGSVNGNTATITAVDQPTGGRFIPNFDPSKIVHSPWGSLTFTFTDCDHGKVDFTATAAGYGSGSMNLTRLTRPAGVVCP